MEEIKLWPNLNPKNQRIGLLYHENKKISLIHIKSITENIHKILDFRKFKGFNFLLLFVEEST